MCTEFKGVADVTRRQLYGIYLRRVDLVWVIGEQDLRLCLRRHLEPYTTFKSLTVYITHYVATNIVVATGALCLCHTVGIFLRGSCFLASSIAATSIDGVYVGFLLDGFKRTVVVGNFSANDHLVSDLYKVVARDVLVVKPKCAIYIERVVRAACVGNIERSISEGGRNLLY